MNLLSLNRVAAISLKLGMLCAALALISCSKPEPIKVALHDWAGYQFPVLAQQESPEKYNQFQVMKTHSASETIEKFKQGEIIAGYLTLDEVIRARSAGINLYVLLVTNISAGADVVIAHGEKSNISARDIIGKTVAYEATAAGQIMLHFFLEKYGVKPNQIIHVNIPYNQHENIFKHRAIDFVVTYYPNANSLLDTNGSVVFSSLETPNTIIDVLAVNANYFTHQPSQACNIVNAHLNGVNQLYTNSADTEYRLAPLFKISHRNLRDSLAKMTIPNHLTNKNLMQKTGDIAEIATNLQQIMVDNHLIDSAMPIESLIDNYCVNQFIEQKR